MHTDYDISRKNILISGSSGMIGSACSRALKAKGYSVYSLKRNTSEGPHYYLQDSDYIHLEPSIPLHAVINLAGQNISKKRWNEKTKKQIVDSRVNLTRSLSQALAQLPKLPEVLLSGSAIGYYGSNSNMIFDESSPAGSDFLASLALQWESATKPASQAGIRTVLLRFGLVLDPSGGIIESLLLPLRFGCVGPIGTGKQIMSWISLNDTVRILMCLITEKKISGPLNLVSNQLISNKGFSQALAQSIKKLSLPRVPSSIIRLMFGEMADAALLSSASIKSIRMDQLGIELEESELSLAMNKMFN